LKIEWENNLTQPHWRYWTKNWTKHWGWIHAIKDKTKQVWEKLIYNQGNKLEN